MKTEEIKLRIAKKEEEIAKREKNLAKYVVEAEFIAICDRYFQTKDRSELDAYRKAHMWLPEYYSKRYELEDAKATLAKYQSQLEAEEAKQNTLSEMPEVLKEFRNNLIDRWDRYDAWKREEIKRDYRKFQEASDSWKTTWMEMNNKWGRGWYDFKDLNDRAIHDLNVTAADTLVLNLIERTVELAGKITDCAGLRIDQDNQGYSIINGLVIGEKGKARVESIGAGGYNIQRYHIRVLVKEVRA